jgi:hypothetical protein
VTVGLWLHPRRSEPLHQLPRPFPGQPPQELLSERLAPRAPDRLREGRSAEGCWSRAGGRGDLSLVRDGGSNTSRERRPSTGTGCSTGTSTPSAQDVWKEPEKSVPPLASLRLPRHRRLRVAALRPAYQPLPRRRITPYPDSRGEPGNFKWYVSDRAQRSVEGAPCSRCVRWVRAGTFGRCEVCSRCMLHEFHISRDIDRIGPSATGIVRETGLTLGPAAIWSISDS